MIKIINTKKRKFEVRLTQEEFEEVNIIIKKFGIKKQEYGKRALLGKKIKYIDDPIDFNNEDENEKPVYFIRLTKEESKKVEEKVKKSGMTKQEFGRRALLNQEIKVFDLGAVKGLMKELNKIGNNINQIARVVNQTRNPEDGQLEAIIKLQKEIWTEMCNLTKIINKNTK